MALVDLQDISMVYHTKDGEIAALASVNLSIAEREFVSIVGPSGCGKSTLLSIVAGLIEPSSGSVLIGGEPVSGCIPQVGYMLQKDQLFPWRTVLGNALLGLEIRKIKTKENIEYVHYLLEKYGLGEFKKSKPSELSGGMRQRAALIRTLATRPKLLLLDEPFSALDYQTRLYVSEEIGNILDLEGVTAILVTHDISESISLSDKVVVLSGRPANVKQVYTIELGLQKKNPFLARKSPLFAKYFNDIWKEIDEK